MDANAVLAPFRQLKRKTAVAAFVVDLEEDLVLVASFGRQPEDGVELHRAYMGDDGFPLLALEDPLIELVRREVFGVFSRAFDSPGVLLSENVGRKQEQRSEC